MKRPLILLFIFCFISNAVFGQETAKRSYKTIKTEKPPVIDGTLNDEAWETGTWDGSFTQFEPFEGKSPSQPTLFKVLYDNSNIYVAFKAFDSAPDSIVDRMTRRDDIDGDFVGVAFDSYHDLRTGFVFMVSSAGVKADQIITEDGMSEDDTWDPIWITATARFEGGWSAEMSIPLTQLRFKSNSGEVWGFEALRQIYRHKEMNFWQAIPRSASGNVHMFGNIEGFENIKPGKQVDMTPYAVGSYEKYPMEAGNPFAKRRDVRGTMGLDGKIGISSNLTLDFTVLPDFGQVEADPSEVNLTAYETFFQEKRPFFIEGKNITSFRVGIGDGDLGNDNLFYSRRIGRRPQLSPDLSDNEYSDQPRTTRILGAAKITGKTQNGLSIGILNAVTAEEKAEIDFNGERRYETVEPLTNYFVSRLQKDMNEGKTIIGGVFTNTYRDLDNSTINSLHRTASSAGFDITRYFWNKNWILTTTVAVSNVQGSKEAIASTQTSSVHYFQRPDADYIKYDPERTSLTGQAGNIQFGKIGGNWNFVYFTIWKSPGFETNDLGYTKKADEFGQLIWSAYSINKPFSIFNRVRFNFNEYVFWDFGGNFTSQGGNFSIYNQFKNQWSTNFGINYSGKSVSNTLLRGGPSMKLPGSFGEYINISSDSRKKIMASVYASYRKGYQNYSESISTNMSISYRPITTFSLTASPAYSISRSQLQYITKESFMGEDRYIFGTLNQKVLSLSFRANYNITPDLSLQYWGQPFLAAISFRDYKRITAPRDPSFTNRFRVFDDTQISFDASNNEYRIDEDLDNNTDYSFDNPEKNNDVFLSNLVLRWEFKPGSTFYMVWSQSRDYNEPVGEFAVWNNVNNLFTSKKPYDVFLLKFSYRFRVR